MRKLIKINEKEENKNTKLRKVMNKYSLEWFACLLAEIK